MKNSRFTFIIIKLQISILLVSMYGCCYYIKREGYTKKDKVDTCEVYFYKNIYITENLKKVGSVNLEETGFTLNCEMDDAFNILEKEACLANANVINITKEYFPDRNNTCYRCDADLYRDTNDPVNLKYIAYKPYKIPQYSPFKNLPFNYICFNKGIDYIFMNKNFWSELLKDYNLPTEEVTPVLLRESISLIYLDYYFDLNLGIAGYASGYGFNSNDSLESYLQSIKLGFDFGYNLLTSGWTLSPYIGFRYYYQNHTISLKNDDLNLEQWMRYPDLTLRTNQLSAVLGINVIYSFYKEWLILGNFGYNLNFHKYPFLNSDESTGIRHNIPLVKNFYISIGFGIGLPLDESYKKPKYKEVEKNNNLDEPLRPE